jgi:uncharacterized protein involved in outer membrane biogenesis
VRKLLISLGILVFVLIGAAFAGPLLVPTDSIKADIASEVRKATGRTLAIDGALNFRLLPAPGISASGVKLSNAGQGFGPEMVRLEGATVEVALLPLISGDVQVTRVVLRKPVILLEQYADGTNNWTFTPEADGSAAAGGAAASSGDPDNSGSGTPPVRLDDVEIVDGTLIYATPDQRERVENINMNLGAGSLTGPFRADGSLSARGFDIALNAAVGELVTGKATPINTQLSTAGAKISYSGVFSGAGETPRVSGRLEVRADDLLAMVSSLSDAAAPPALRGKSLELDGMVTATAAAVSVNDLALRLGEGSATGAVDVKLGDGITADVVFNMQQLDLDRLLAETNGASPAGGSGAPPSGKVPARPAPAATQRDARGFAIPENISASLETKIDTLVYRGGVVRQVLLNAEVVQGAVNISRASVQLPGGSTANLVGLVTPDPVGPKFDGQVEISSDDLRSLLAWAGTDVSSVPPDRLRKMAGSMSVSATPENVTLTDIDVSVDVSRLRGGVAIALRERPGFGVGLSLDKLNADAYLLTSGAAPVTGGAPSGGSIGSSAASGAPASSGNAGGSPLAALNAFDAILQLKVGELTYQGQRLRGFILDSTLQSGVLELRDVSVASLEGAKISAKGQVNGLDVAPSADLTIGIDAPDVDALLALAGVTPPAPIGPGKLNGTFRGDPKNLDIDTTLQALGANLRASGTVAALAAPPRYDLTLDLKHPDASAFFGRLGWDAGVRLVTTGALVAAVTAKGDLNALDLAANIGIGEGSIDIDGRLENLAAGEPTGALALGVNHPDMVSFVRTFANDYRPALAQAGPFILKTDIALKPELIMLSKLEGKAGPVSYAGTGQLATGGVRPALTAELNTSEIIVDWFLPVGSVNRPASSGSGGGGAVAPGGRSSGSAGGGATSPGGRSSGSAGDGERWSRERLDLSVLRAADADIKLSAPAITYTDIKVDQPQLAMTLKDEVLELTKLSGKAFGGGFGMTAQVADRKIPTMRYALKVDGADAAKFLGGASGGGDNKGLMSALELLFPVSNLKLVSGTLGADVNVSSHGRSEFEMISNLSGKGAMTFTNAVIEGIDVCRISDQLDRLNGLQGFVGLAASALGGQTKISNFNGRFDIANGVATLPQQQLNPECANVTFAGTTNLPAWLVDIQARASFPAHTDFPGVVVGQKGPLDAPNTRLINVNEINQYVAGKAAGTVLPKLLPGSSQEQPAAGQTSSEPTKPADQFKKLLEGLIRR